MNKKLILPAIGLVVVLFAGWQGWNWFNHGRWTVVTDNAYIRADITMIAAKSEGYVREVSVADNSTVQAI
jgi:membrane fusion protein, multidrug efflux system